MLIKNINYNFKIALEAIVQNKLRSFLTSLGIIFGVASVITMLAIGSGAEKEIIEKIKLLGANNIIIEALSQEEKKEAAEEEEEENPQQEETNFKRFSPGLSLSDSDNFADIVPGIKNISVETFHEIEAISEGKAGKANLVGVDLHYFEINGFSLKKGKNFNKKQVRQNENVCIVGSGIKTKFFPKDDPVGKYIKCDNRWLKIIGVLDSRSISSENIKMLGIRDYNREVYIPISTYLLRFKNNSLITKKDLANGRRNRTNTNIELNQLNRIVVQVENTAEMKQIAEVLEKVLYRRHNQVKDYKIIIPEELLKQEKETKRIFNIVLGAIASISLIVGGIGIMNIMLASVMERTKEIGVRKAVGAKRRDIMLQFLIEAISLSVTGGLIGILFGVLGTYFVEYVTGISTIIKVSAVMLSFLVSISVGLIFGIAPARKASRQDPIDLLRYE